MTLHERVEAYKAAFPQYPDSWPVVSPTGRWLNAIWLGGANYKGNGYYGSYPPYYLPRLRALYPDVDPSVWLHLYGGSLGRDVAGYRVELRGDAEVAAPTVRADCKALPFLDGLFPFVAADPPYTELDAEAYHTPKGLNKPLVLAEAARVTHAGAHLAWLDTTLPLYKGTQWRHYGMICVQRSTNHRTRLLSLFERL